MFRQSSSVLIYTKYKVEFKVYYKMLIRKNKQYKQKMHAITRKV